MSTAARNFNRKQALEKEIKDIYVKVSIGAAGAPTLADTPPVGVASISRTGTGAYTLTLQDAYYALRYVKVVVQTSTPEDLKVQLTDNSVSTAKTVSFVTLTGATPTDPANGDTLVIKLELKNSSVVEH